MRDEIKIITANRYNTLGDEFYYNGQYRRAFKNFHRAMELGYADAKANVALCYQTGHGVKVDIEKAIQLYYEAIDEGSILAVNNLADFYLYDFDDHETKMQGVQLYIKSAVDFHDAKAALILAKDIFDDIGIFPNRNDYIKALRLAEKNALNLKLKDCDEKLISEIYYRMYIYYTEKLEGKAKPRMQQELYKEYVSRLESGDYTAAVGIAFLYRNGIFVARDSNLSKEYLTRASKHNIEFANYLLKNGGIINFYRPVY